MSDVSEQVPVARVGERTSIEERIAWYGSRMWWLAAAALMVAIGLVWWSLPEGGVSIRIHFPEGHGLQVDDAVRFRGIDVGVVREVTLNRELSGIDVDVDLKPFAARLASEGTRFWIVRPELSLTGISGLETAVGHKYIGVLPGDVGEKRRYSFEGLSEVPPDAKAEPGFEIIIRGDERHSINAGSPVTCRGIEVGRVLSTELSRNARFVDVRARIYERYRSFLNSETRFWASSGVDLDFSIGAGLKVEAESLETIARGGVAMLTISNEGAPVKVGQVFKLYKRPEADWFKAAEKVRINDVQLGHVVPLQVNWKQKGFLRTSTQSKTFGGVPVNKEGRNWLLVPLDAIEEPEKALAETFSMSIVGQSDEIADHQKITTARTQTAAGGLLVWLPVSDSVKLDWCQPQRDFRVTEDVEDCLAVRATGDLGSYEYLHLSIDKDLLFIDPQTGNQVLRFFDGDKSIWHGAPVQSVADGKIVGILLTDEKRTIIAGVKDLLQAPGETESAKQ